MHFSKSREWNCLKSILKSSKFNKKRYTKKQMHDVMIDLINNLFKNSIDVLITECSNLEDEGMCLINIAPFENQLYFLLCKFNYTTEDFLFYDFKTDKTFYSSKKVIEEVRNSKCLFFF